VYLSEFFLVDGLDEELVVDDIFNNSTVDDSIPIANQSPVGQQPNVKICESKS